MMDTRRLKPTEFNSYANGYSEMIRVIRTEKFEVGDFVQISEVNEYTDKPTGSYLVAKVSKVESGYIYIRRTVVTRVYP
jgi:hypothetical protein